MKDMQANNEVIYRPNAIRALCRIIDVRFTCSFYACRVTLTSLAALDDSGR